MSIFKPLIESFSNPSKLKKETPQSLASASSTDAFWGYSQNDLVQAVTATNKEWIRRYHEMIQYDYVVRAFASTLQLLISSMTFEIEENEEDENDELHELAEKMFVDWGSGDFNAFLREYVSTFLFGYSVFEIVLREDEIGYVVDDMVFHPQVYLTAEWDDAQKLKGFTSRVTETMLDINRLMYSQGVGNFDHNVYGQSLLKSAYIHYRNKLQVMSNEMYHVKANLEGIPVVGIDTSVEGWQTTWNQMKLQLQAIKAGKGSGVMMPSNTYTDADGKVTNIPKNSIELMSVNGSKFIDTNALIQREDTAIARSLMAEFLVMVGQDSGSYALSKETTSMFKLLVEGIAQHLCDTFTHQVIKPLWVLNGQDFENMPKLVYDSVDLSLDSMAVFINALSGAGVTFTESQEDYLFSYAGIPKPSNEERTQLEADKLMMNPLVSQNPNTALNGTLEEETVKVDPDPVEE